MTPKQEDRVAHVVVYTVLFVGVLVSVLVLVGCARERVLRDGTILRTEITAEEVLAAVDGLIERSPEVAMKYLEMKLAFQEAKLRELELEQAALAVRQTENGVGAEPQIDARLSYVLTQVTAVKEIIDALNEAKGEIE